MRDAMGEPQQSATRDAIATSIYATIQGVNYEADERPEASRLASQHANELADEIALVVDAARVEGERRGLARATAAVKALAMPAFYYDWGGENARIAWVGCRDALLAVLEQQEDADAALERRQAEAVAFLREQREVGRD
jgi:hypothetical protein